MTILQEKISNPLNFYKNPNEVALDDKLSDEQKMKVLINWLNDIELREVAEGENMPAAREPREQHVALIERLLRSYQRH